MGVYALEIHLLVREALRLSSLGRQENFFANYRAIIKRVFIVLLDCICIIAAFMLAVILRFDAGQMSAELHFFSRCLPFILPVFIIFFSIFRLYNTLWKHASYFEVFLVGISTTVSMIVCYVISVIFKKDLGEPLNLAVCLVAWMLVNFFVVIYRIGYRVVRVLYKRVTPSDEENGKRILIVGAGAAGSQVIRNMIENDYKLGRPVVVVDNNPVKQNSWILGVPVAGFSRDIPRLVKEYGVTDIILAIPTINASEQKSVLDICTKTDCRVRIMPPLSEMPDPSKPYRYVRDVDIVDLLGRPEIKADMQIISAYLKDKTVMVTGGGGSIGSELCRQIVKQIPKRLIIFDVYENSAYEIQNEILRKYGDGIDLTVLIGSVRDKKRLEQIFEEYRPQVVFHAAAHKHVPLMEDSPAEAVKNNIMGTKNLAEVADAFGVEKFVLISTDKAVNATNIMGATKRCCEKVIQTINKHSKTEYVAVRFGNVLGSNGSVIPLFRRQIETGGPVTVTHPEVTRFFMTIPEAVSLVIEAGGMAKGGEIFVLDMGKPVRIRDLAENLIRLSGLEPGKDIQIEYVGLRPGEKMYEELMLEKEDGLKSTNNQMIFVTQPVDFDEEEFLRDLQDIKECAESNNVDGMIPALKRLVPTYQPQEGSRYYV